jgi:hypothetical protein
LGDIEQSGIEIRVGPITRDFSALSFWSHILHLWFRRKDC